VTLTNLQIFQPRHPKLDVRCSIHTWMKSVLVRVSTESSIANVGLSSAIKHMQS
jgi:hypothetical protein